MAQLVISSTDSRVGPVTPLPYVVLTWTSDDGLTTSTYRWGAVPFAAPEGAVTARVLRWGDLTLALSGAQGVPESVLMDVDLSDVDRAISTLLADPVWSWLPRQSARVSLHTRASALSSDTPITLLRGVVREYRTGRRRTATLTLEDALVVSYGQTQELLPRRRLQTTQFADAPLAVLGMPEPIIYGWASDGGDAPGPTLTIATSVAGNPATLTTTTAHGFITGQHVNISGHSVSALNGHHVVTVVDDETFTVPVQAPDSGTGGSVYVQNALGLVPCIPVGTEVIASVVWTRFLVAGHACKSVMQVFAGGNLQAGVGYAGPVVVGVDLLAPIPGYTATEWPHPNVYVDIAGRRYTLIYAKGDLAANALSGDAPLTVNVQGVETVGDGSGTTVVDLCQQYQHFLTNFVLGDYQSGAWLSVPTFPDGTARIDTASFTAAQAALDARTGVGDYEGAGVLGNLGELKTAADWVADWNRCCDVRSVTRLGGAVAVVVPEAAAATWDHTQTHDIVRDSFDTPTSSEDVRNVVPYSCRRNYRVNDWLNAGATVYNAAAITALGGARIVDTVQEYPFVRDPDIAENLAAYRLRRLKNGLRRVTWSTGLHGLAAQPGTTGTLTHADGPDASGWTARTVLVERMRVDLSSCLVTLTALDLDAWDASLDYATTPAVDASSRAELPALSYGLSVPPAASSGGTGSVFVGYGIPLGGSNIQTLSLTTSWQDVGEANPMPHPADPAGTWTLRVYAYQLSAGTMEVRLLVGGVEVASVSTTATGSYVDVSFFGSALTDTYTGPGAVGQCLLQARVTSGSRVGVVGQCHTVKTS